MKYIVFYKSTNGKNYFERVQSSTREHAIRVVKDKYNDIAEIVDCREDR